MYYNRYHYPMHFMQMPAYRKTLTERIAATNVSVISKINEYIARALYYIDYIIRMIQSSSPYIEKVQPLLDDLPTMYQLMKAFQQLSNAEEAETTNTFDHPNHLPKPTLFI